MKIHEQRDRLETAIRIALDRTRIFASYLQSSKFNCPDDYVRTWEPLGHMAEVRRILRIALEDTE